MASSRPIPIPTSGQPLKPLTPRNSGSYGSPPGRSMLEDRASPKTSPRIRPRFKMDLESGKRRDSSKLVLPALSPLTPRKSNLLTAVLSPEIVRKKVSFARADSPKLHPRHSFPPPKQGPKPETPDVEANGGPVDEDVDLPQRHPLPATSSVFQQALTLLEDQSEDDSDTISSGNSPLPGDLHVRRSSLIAAMTELQLSAIRNRIEDHEEEDEDEENEKSNGSTGGSFGSSSSRRQKSGSPQGQDKKEQTDGLKKMRMRKISAPCKLQHGSPTSAWKLPDDSHRASPKPSPLMKRRTVSVIAPPRLSELDTSRHDGRRFGQRLGDVTSNGDLSSHQIRPSTPSSSSSSGLTPTSSPRVLRRQSTLKEMNAVSKYIQLASSGIGGVPTKHDYYDNSRFLSPRQLLARRGIAADQATWLNDGLGDITEVTTFEEIKKCRYIRRRRGSTQYNEI